MKSIGKTVLLLGLAALMMSGSLKASEVVGKFTLKSPVLWGSVLLPPAEYTFTFDRAVLGGDIILSCGKKGVAFIRAEDMAQTEPSGPSTMVIVAGHVRALHLAPLGLTYEYKSSQDHKKVVANNLDKSTVTVPIAVGGM